MHGARRVLIGLSLAAVVIPVQAAFVDHSTYSTDTATGLDWLDVTQTAGIHYPSMVAGAGGWLASGWRYATGAEVTDLFTRYIGPQQYPGYQQGDGYTAALAIVRQLGVSISFNNSEGINAIYGSNYGLQISSVGWFDDGTDNDILGRAELGAITRAGTSGFQPYPDLSGVWGVYADSWPLSAGNGYSPPTGYGSFLVRTTLAVPEPGTILLVVGALLMLALAHSTARGYRAL